MVEGRGDRMGTIMRNGEHTKGAWEDGTGAWVDSLVMWHVIDHLQGHHVAGVSHHLGED